MFLHLNVDLSPLNTDGSSGYQDVLLYSQLKLPEVSLGHRPHHFLPFSISRRSLGCLLLWQGLWTALPLPCPSEPAAVVPHVPSAAVWLTRCCLLLGLSVCISLIEWGVCRSSHSFPSSCAWQSEVILGMKDRYRFVFLGCRSTDSNSFLLIWAELDLVCH